MIFDHALKGDDKAPSWYREIIQGQFAPLEKILSPLFVNAQKELALTARDIWNAVHGICYMQVQEKMPIVHDQDANKMLECLIENLIAGIETRRKN